jgi:hypothetical protein
MKILRTILGHVRLMVRLAWRRLVAAGVRAHA